MPPVFLPWLWFFCSFLVGAPCILPLLIGCWQSPAAGDILGSVESPYQTIYVTQKGDVRYLRGGSLLAVSSAQDLKQPFRHVLEYSALMMLGFGYVDDPREICILGLGGGTLPSYIRRYYPVARITNVEFDAAMEKMAQEWFGFRPDDRMRVVIEDGRRFLQKGRKQYDLILLDAYHGDYIPFHLLTREFLELVRDRLAPGGAVVANTWARQGLYERESATYAAVFGGFDSFLTRRAANRIVIARKGGGRLPFEQLARRVERLQEQKEFREVDLPALLAVSYDPQVTWPPSTPLLVDDYAPVNLLSPGEGP